MYQTQAQLTTMLLLLHTTNVRVLFILVIFSLFMNTVGKACAGLVIFSKFPIRQAHQIKYHAKGAGTDRAAKKGFCTFYFLSFYAATSLPFLDLHLSLLSYPFFILLSKNTNFQMRIRIPPGIHFSYFITIPHPALIFFILMPIYSMCGIGCSRLSFFYHKYTLTSWLR